MLQYLLVDCTEINYEIWFYRYYIQKSFSDNPNTDFTVYANKILWGKSHVYTTKRD